MGIEGRSPYLDSGMIDLWESSHKRGGFWKEKSGSRAVWRTYTRLDRKREKILALVYRSQEWAFRFDGPGFKKGSLPTLKEFRKEPCVNFMPHEMRRNYSKNPEQLAKTFIFLILY